MKDYTLLCHLCDIPFIYHDTVNTCRPITTVWKYTGKTGYKFDKDDKITKTKCKKEHNLNRLYKSRDLDEKHKINMCNCLMDQYYLCKGCYYGLV